MILKRLPLFITGLLYGFVVNCAVLGLVYGGMGLGFGLLATGMGLWAAKKELVKWGLVAIIFGFIMDIGNLNNLSQLTLTDIGQISYNSLNDYLYNVLMICGGVVLGITAIAFTTGVVYGLTFGTWHCAMDFYNNGLKQGVTSPFRFLSAHWQQMRHNNKDPLKDYYKSTEVGLYEKKNSCRTCNYRTSKNGSCRSSFCASK